jgi:hypothetical protein
MTRGVLEASGPLLAERPWSQALEKVTSGWTGTPDLGNQAPLSRDSPGCCNPEVLLPVLPASVLCCLRSQSVQIFVFVPYRWSQ